MQLDFIFNRLRQTLAPNQLVLKSHRIPVLWLRNPRSRRYILRLRADGVARVTIPRGGSLAEARRFAERHQAWLEQQLARLASQPVRAKAWDVGTEILVRGRPVKLATEVVAQRHLIQIGDEAVRVADSTGDLRPSVERHLWGLAAQELPPRVLELAALHQLSVVRITVRNQRSRWGSYSRRGTISLNWRLIQAPPFVRDYIILHELMHLRQMNHSARFWQEVELVCPDYRTAERWLKQNSSLLR